ncbi:uncharacterized protein BDZ99DRAFT_210432 [Mytilinidion resinicola]|uniref:Uncharacterized protein n=1 Tax=Mytilinidion resinicola TaxID=574789 RepID=A0A6A6Y2X3_9PEZI|nr:uncharacterized protein BDZ99DRAFT_210432 [Mytilinidion resinicola]KAF2802137.1 hypothetical protein BDZ99DRAFT_210432 [Mytilinidion resinicola]
MRSSRSEGTPNPPSYIDPRSLMAPPQRNPLTGAPTTTFAAPRMLRTLLPTPQVAAARPDLETTPLDPTMTPAGPSSSLSSHFTYDDTYDDFVFTPQGPDAMDILVTGPAGNTPFLQRAKRAPEDQTSPHRSPGRKRMGEVAREDVATTAADPVSMDASYIAEGAALLSTLAENVLPHESDPSQPKPEVLIYAPGPHTGLSLEETELEYPVFYYDNAPAFKRLFEGDEIREAERYEQAREGGETWEERLRGMNREGFTHRAGNRSRSTSQAQTFVRESVETEGGGGRGGGGRDQDENQRFEHHGAQQSNLGEGQQVDQSEHQSFVQHQDQPSNSNDGQQERHDNDPSPSPRPPISNSVRRMLHARALADPDLKRLITASLTGHATPEERELASRRLKALHHTLTQEQAASEYRAAEMARALEAQKAILKTVDAAAKEQALQSRGFRSTPLRPRPELSREEMVLRFGERATAAHLATKAARAAGADSAEQAAQELETLTRGAPSMEDALYHRRPGRGSARVGSLPEGFTSTPARRAPRSEVVEEPVEMESSWENM